MDRASLIFCIASLAVCLGLSALLFPFAALSPEAAAAAATPTPAEEMADVDLGDFGVVPVLDLVGNWIENPPQPKAAGGGAAGHAVRFQGC